MKYCQSSSSRKEFIVGIRPYIVWPAVIVALLSLVLWIALPKYNYVYRELLNQVSAVSDKEYIKSVSVEKDHRLNFPWFRVELYPNLADELVEAIMWEMMDNLDELLYHNTDKRSISSGLFPGEASLYVISTDPDGLWNGVQSERRIKFIDGKPTIFLWKIRWKWGYEELERPYYHAWEGYG
jgi:hypothetical protein